MPFTIFKWESSMHSEGEEDSNLSVSFEVPIPNLIPFANCGIFHPVNSVSFRFSADNSQSLKEYSIFCTRIIYVSYNKCTSWLVMTWNHFLTKYAAICNAYLPLLAYQFFTSILHLLMNEVVLCYIACFCTS